MIICFANNDGAMPFGELIGPVGSKCDKYSYDKHEATIWDKCRGTLTQPGCRRMISVYPDMGQTTFFPCPSLECGLHMDPAPKLEGESAFNPVNLSLRPMDYLEATLTVSRGRMAMICLPDAGVPYTLCSAHRRLTRGRFSQRLVPWRILVLRICGVLWDESFLMAGRESNRRCSRTTCAVEE